MNNYFRITGYCKEQDFCFVVDSYGYYDKLWELSSAFVTQGLDIIAVSSSEKFLDGSIPKRSCDNDNIYIRAEHNGRPQDTILTVNGVTYKALKVGDKIYVPDKTKTT